MGPNPGKKPKKVGDEVTPKLKRFPCRTQSPFVLWLRIRNAPLVVFAIFTLGCNFQVRLRIVGRLIPVCQSRSELKEPIDTWETVILSVGSGVLSSGILSPVTTVRPVVF